MAGETTGMQSRERARSLTEQGQAALAAGRALSALNFYDDALRLDPEFVPALHGRCHALQVIGRPADVVAACERALALTPDGARLHYSRGVGLRRPGRFGEAGAGFRGAIALTPADAEAISGWDWFWKRKGNCPRRKRPMRRPLHAIPPMPTA